MPYANNKDADQVENARRHVFAWCGSIDGITWRPTKASPDCRRHRPSTSTKVRVTGKRIRKWSSVGGHVIGLSDRRNLAISQWLFDTKSLSFLSLMTFRNIKRTKWRKCNYRLKSYQEKNWDLLTRVFKHNICTSSINWKLLAIICSETPLPLNLEALMGALGKPGRRKKKKNTIIDTCYIQWHLIKVAEILRFALMRFNW